MKVKNSQNKRTKQVKLNSNKDSSKKIFFTIFFVSLLALTIYMIKPFLTALTIAALVAYFLYPISEKLQKKVKKRILVEAILSVASVLILFVISAVMIVPIANQAADLYLDSESYLSINIEDSCPGVEPRSETNPPSFKCKSLIQLSNFLKDDNFQNKAKMAIQKIASPLVGGVTELFGFALSFFVSLFVSIFAIFYFLENGSLIKDKITTQLPLNENYKQKIISRLTRTIDAVVKGNIITSLLQGLLGAIIFLILGIPLALFWGVIMVVFAFIPAVGPAVVWAPAAIILFLLGSPVKAIILIVYCITILGYIDNVLKPKLIGKKIQLSSFTIFLGVLGGLQLFGILGLFIGPIILALLVTCSDIYFELNGSK